MAACRTPVALAIFCALGCGSSSPAGLPGAAVADGSIDAGATVPDASSEGRAVPPAADAAPNAADASSASMDASDTGTSTVDATPAAGGRAFPDTTATIAVLADQLPSMTAAQVQFAATHYVGTQKQLLGVSRALRQLNPGFLVLHYHLAMWQSAPAVSFIVDGRSWGNDFPTVTTHEDWFWHNAGGQRVASNADAKLLMNVSSAAFQAYWADSLARQVAAGEYDAVFLDSASPALLQGECGGADPRLAATAARDTVFAELGSASWIHAWQAWTAALGAALAAQGIALIPNTGALITGWDNTDYGLTSGIFSEGFAGTKFAPSDWQASTDRLLSLVAADKIVILQNYLARSDDVATRLYYLGNYLLVKGRHTYLDYFAAGPLEWYPEWNVDLGAPTTTAPAKVSALLDPSGVYRRDFAKGSVLVNPSSSPVTVALGGGYRQMVPTGGGAVDGSGAASGSVTTTPVTSVVVVAATSAAIVLR